MSSTKNPYELAAQKYGGGATRTPKSAQQIEAEALLKSARGLQQFIDDWPQDLKEKQHFIPKLTIAVQKNRDIWTVFYNAADQRQAERHSPLQQNIMRLSQFVFSQSLSVISEPSAAKLESLISLNRTIADGLMDSDTE